MGRDHVDEVPTLAADYRDCWGRANLALAPHGAAALLLAADLWLTTTHQVPRALTIGLAPLVVCWFLSLGHLLVLAAVDSPAPALRLWRQALVMALVSPATSLACLISLVAIAAVWWTLPAVGILFGPAAAIMGSVLLCHRRLVQAAS